MTENARNYAGEEEEAHGAGHFTTSEAPTVAAFEKANETNVASPFACIWRECENFANKFRINAAQMSPKPYASCRAIVPDFLFSLRKLALKAGP